MLKIAQFREFIIKPTLEALHLDSSNDAEELLVFTCANESLGGTYIKQEKGPALGIYQMEPATYNDLWQNYIMKKSTLSLIIGSNFDAHRMPDEQRLIYDLRFATAMSRIFYLRIDEALPKANDVDAIWEYYKKYYNTEKGAATKTQALSNYHHFLSS